MKVEIWETLISTRLKTNRSVYDDELCPEIDKLVLTVDELENYWQGSDFTYFKETITPFLNDLKKLKESIDTYHSYVDGYLKAYENLIKVYQDKNLTLK
mgnify:CR=1 FL=1